MKIRTAQSGDEWYIANVIINTWKAAYQGIVSNNFLDALTTENHKALYKNHIVNPVEAVFVLVNENEQIVGVASGGPDRSLKYDCEIVAIYILPAYQKKGFGKLLFKQLIGIYKRNGFKSLLIWTFKENRDRKFYEKLGGVVREEMRYFFAGEEVPIVGYTWQDIARIPF